MRIRRIAAALLTAGAAALPLAPVAAAASGPAPAVSVADAPQCTTTVVSSKCTSPGNTQIYATPNPSSFYPMYGAYGYFPWIW